MIFVCKTCGKNFNKKPSTKAKYCCIECMRKDPDYKKSCGNNHKWSMERIKKMNEARQNMIMEKYGQYENRHVKLKDGTILNITNKELEEYRKTHLVCEICGKVEKITRNKKTNCKLSCDHDHKTNNFRGLLCNNCNTKLGWFENYENKIINYLHNKN